MLARRFTIVCLLAALFGHVLAIVVTKASHPVRSVGLACIEGGFACTAPDRD